MRRRSSVGIQRIASVPRPADVGGLLNPRVRLGRRVDSEARRPTAADAALAHVPAGLRGARGEQADDVGHVAAADEQAAAVGRVADELGDPADGLRLDLRGRRRQRPGAHVRIDRRRQEIAEHADRRRRRRDVAEEARMGVEQRVLEQHDVRAVPAAAAGRFPFRAAAPRRSSALRTAEGDSSRVTGPRGSASSSSAS